MAGLEEVANWASHHHENHLGTGYPEHLTKDDITEEMDVISYADIFTSLAENRPYRAGLKLSQIMSLLENDFQTKHGTKVYKLIEKNQEWLYVVCKEAISLGEKRYDRYKNLSMENCFI